MVESQLLSPRGFKQLSRTVITHTYTHLLCSPSPYLSTPFLSPVSPFLLAVIYFFSFNPILGPASSVFAHFFPPPSIFCNSLPVLRDRGRETRNDGKEG